MTANEMPKPDVPLDPKLRDGPLAQKHQLPDMSHKIKTMKRQAHGFRD